VSPSPAAGPPPGARLGAVWSARDSPRRGRDAGSIESEEERDLEPDHGAIGAEVVGSGEVDIGSVLTFG